MRAKEVILLAVNRNKADIVRRIVLNSYEESPSAASYLFHYHPSVRLFVNDGAASLLGEMGTSALTETHDIFEDRILLLKPDQRFLAGERVICFSPHPDDTSISAGASLSMLTESNKVTSCVATTGHRAFIPDTTPAQRVVLREKEATTEAEILGATCDFLRLPLYENGKLSDDDVRIVEEYLRISSPTVLFIPHTADTHPTHREVLKVVLSAVRRLFRNKIPYSTGHTEEVLRLFMYEGPWSLFPPGSYNTIISPTAESFAKKQAAILAHKSQVERTAYDKAADSLATMRGVLVPEQDLAGFGGTPPEVGPQIELFYYYPVRFASDVDQLLSWLEERKHPQRLPHLRL